VTKLDEYLLPRIDDTLDLHAGNEYFSTLDLASGYWQVRMDAASWLSRPYGSAFGLVNVPVTFQRLMEVVLYELVGKKCLVYLDVLGKTMKEVLERLRAAWLRLKPKKWKFSQLQVLYLGHVVSVEGVRTDPAKLEAV
jgi:hypothetical protein